MQLSQGAEGVAAIDPGAKANAQHFLAQVGVAAGEVDLLVKLEVDGLPTGEVLPVDDRAALLVSK